ncbi:MAG: SixA phosphatase family protein [Anaerolineae bacterium]
MRKLVLLRHGKSSWSDEGLADHDRPLKERGLRDAPRMGALAAELDIVPELIISSSAERAVRTAELFAEGAGFEGEIVITEMLYGASPDDYVAALGALAGGEGTVMLVGHNPALEELLELLVGSWERLPTAAVAVVELPWAHWGHGADDAEGAGRLAGVWRPRELAD